MREVIYKNLTSVAQRKKDITLKEIFERQGVIARTERRCFYYIKDIKKLENEDEFKGWVDFQNNQNTTKRHFHILRQHNDAIGENKLICKIAGTFYVVSERTVYTIAFLHSFKVSFIKAHHV